MVLGATPLRPANDPDQETGDRQRIEKDAVEEFGGRQTRADSPVAHQLSPDYTARRTPDELQAEWACERRLYHQHEFEAERCITLYVRISPCAE